MHRELKQYLSENKLTSLLNESIELLFGFILKDLCAKVNGLDRTHKNILTTLKCITTV